VVSVKLIYSLHFLENKMFHEQSLYAAFDLDNLNKKNDRTGNHIQIFEILRRRFVRDGH